MTSPASSADTSATSVPGAEQRLSLLSLLLVLGRHKRLVAGLPTLALLASVIAAFALPKWYTATTKILPPQQSQSSALAMLGQLSALSSGASQALGLKNPSDIYVAMIRSRTIADRIVGHFDLMQTYGLDTMVDARKELSRNSTVTSGRDGTITIDVEDRSPLLAAEIANQYVGELRKLTANLAIGEASQRRLFFEAQLKTTKQDLASAEVSLQNFAKESGLINPENQLSLSVSAAAALRVLVSAKEIQLAAMRTFATEVNPEITRAVQELGGLRRELAKLEKDTGGGRGDIFVPFGKAPEVGLEYVRRYRDVKYFETLFEVLAKQYEVAKIDEAKDATLIQVLDVAVPPERKSSPKRAVLVSVTFLLSLVVSILFALVTEAIKRIADDPERRLQLRELRRLMVPNSAQQPPAN